jgi:hypothetical protein
MQEIHTNVIKSKHVAFRLAYSDWLRLIQMTSSLNLSITDYMHSLLLPALNEYPESNIQFKPIVKHEEIIQPSETEHISFGTNPPTNNRKVSSEPLFPKKYQEMLNHYL